MQGILFAADDFLLKIQLDFVRFSMHLHVCSAGWKKTPLLHLQSLQASLINLTLMLRGASRPKRRDTH